MHITMIFPIHDSTRCLKPKHPATLLMTMLFFLITTSGSDAALTLCRIFSSGMVLQRDIEIPVWGRNHAGDMVSVSFNGVFLSTETDSTGFWLLTLPENIAGGPYEMSVTSGPQKLSVSDIYIGDVWLASGQSNMEFALNNAEQGPSAAAAANDPLLRQFKVPRLLVDEPSDELPAGSIWRPATTQYAGNFSAVGYFFGRELRSHIGVPVGIINTSLGGSRIETWMSEDWLGYDEQDIVLANGEPERQATVAYNRMIHPLRRFPIRGVIWYQGESNADNMTDALAYGDLFRTLITELRALWGQGDFPFLWVQLPGYGSPSEQPRTTGAWPLLRSEQTAALALPNTGQAVTIDVGDADIHPPKKEPVGYRLSLLARKLAYGEDIVASGPCYLANTFCEDGRIAIRYSDTGSGLIGEGSADGTIDGFAVAGRDNQLKWADAVIAGDQVMVWHADVPDPVIVRYAWEYNPSNANLYNAEDLPAAPFNAWVRRGFEILFFESDLSAVETGQSAVLSWLVYNAVSVTLDGVPVDSSGTFTVTPAVATTYTLRAVNRNDPNESDSATVTIEVLDPNLINRALYRPATASTFETTGGIDRIPHFAVDGDMQTRWSSAWQSGGVSVTQDPNLDDDPENEWIAVDFGEAIDIDRVIIYWETAYGLSYDLEVSWDGTIWKTVYEERTGDGEQDDIVFDMPPAGRYLRMHGLKRGTQFGYSLYEMAVYGRISTLRPPTVQVQSDGGNVFLPDTEVTFTAGTTDEDGHVQSVSFYLDSVLLTTDHEAPFEASWMSAGAGEHMVTAVATDDDSLSVRSEPYMVFVDDGTLVRYEAEHALTTGQAAKSFSRAASGFYYMTLRDAWTITFRNITVPESGEYFLSIGYQLTFDSPKSQYLVINNDTLSTIEFTAPSTSAWLQLGLKVPLSAGDNDIAIHGLWNWMSIDFIAVEGAVPSDVHGESVVPAAMRLGQNFPNPFNSETTIGFSVAAPCHVTLILYDALGRDVMTILNEPKTADEYRVTLNTADLSSGIYFCKMQAGDYLAARKLLLLK